MKVNAARISSVAPQTLGALPSCGAGNFPLAGAGAQPTRQLSPKAGKMLGSEERAEDAQCGTVLLGPASSNSLVRSLENARGDRPKFFGVRKT